MAVSESIMLRVNVATMTHAIQNAKSLSAVMKAALNNHDQKPQPHGLVLILDQLEGELDRVGSELKGADLGL